MEEMRTEEREKRCEQGRERGANRYERDRCEQRIKTNKEGDRCERRRWSEVFEEGNRLFPLVRGGFQISGIRIGLVREWNKLTTQPNILKGSPLPQSVSKPKKPLTKQGLTVYLFTAKSHKMNSSFSQAFFPRKPPAKRIFY